MDANNCPKCGGELITRKGKYGDFKGRKNYPKCRFTITN
ncbi:topoisomerase DNA-binding C4 zinc finger domain-containing protein [Desulfosporosinus sp. I2]|nr:topoisomerase DNA-binding C4 zinc finger domain-containing protein [Desulfosporosinus sp. I2]